MKRKHSLTKKKTDSKFSKKDDDFNIKDLVKKLMKKNAGKNYRGTKLMVNRHSGKPLFVSRDSKSSNQGTFVIEPYMFNKPKCLTNSDDKLFLLSKKKKMQSNSFTMPDSSDIYFINEDDPLKDHISKNLPSFCKLVTWAEGNINKVTDFISLSSDLKKRYCKMAKEPSKFNHEVTIEITNATEEPNSSTSCPQVSASSIFLSIKNVMKRIDKLQEETMTKYISDYKTKGFSDPPMTFKTIQYELFSKRRYANLSIPNTGMPFILVGTWMWICHLASLRKRKFPEKKSEANSKKVGCPASLMVVKIAKFPDFDISDLSDGCITEALKEITDAWDTSSNRVRYFIEYHLIEPAASDHQNHSVNSTSNKFNEPIDPRVESFVRELVRSGETKSLEISRRLRQFVSSEIFAGVSNPPLDRRRYNPTRRDITYIVSKEKLDLKRSGKSLGQVQLSASISALDAEAKRVDDEDCLIELRGCLDALREGLAMEGKLELLKNMRSSLSVAKVKPSTVKTKTKVRKKPETPPVDTPVISWANDGAYLFNPLSTPGQEVGSVPEQFYITDIAQDIVFGNPADLANMDQGLVEAPAADPAVAGVYYFHADGSCSIMAQNSSQNVQS